MSIIHVNQIKNQLLKLFSNLVDLSDLLKQKPENKESFFLTRSLAAYAIHMLSGADPADAAMSITDGSNDNGLDAIYLDEPNKRLYLVQSKWIHDGTGEPDNGEIKKFMGGVRDLFNLRFDRFNPKIVSKRMLISQALNDPSTRYEIVVAHTGSSRLAMPSARDLQDMAKEMNDTSEVLFTTILNQSELHNSLTIGVAGEPINLQINLRSWGRKESPQDAYYGQLSGDQIGAWWMTYRSRLFARNLRSMLGETDVNAEMRQTLESRPMDFWYFNNGITIVARRASRAMAGGASNDLATFHCEDVSIVNGAQTVGTIGKFAEANPKQLQDVAVPVRIIVRGDNQGFGEEVTRTNNRQNRIENRDFVALDPEQSRIRTELAIDGIDYQLVRSEAVARSDKAFDLVEATTALACASKLTRHAVQLKREIGKLWDDITKAPYRELFNATIPGIFVWRCVQIQRVIDKALESFSTRKGSQAHYAVVTHGNRMIAALVFEHMPLSKFKEPGFDLSELSSDKNITSIVDPYVEALEKVIELHYPNSIIPTLFKNLKKCEHISAATKAVIASPS